MGTETTMRLRVETKVVNLFATLTSKQSPSWSLNHALYPSIGKFNHSFYIIPITMCINVYLNNEQRNLVNYSKMWIIHWNDIFLNQSQTSECLSSRKENLSTNLEMILFWIPDHADSENTITLFTSSERISNVTFSTAIVAYHIVNWSHIKWFMCSR